MSATDMYFSADIETDGPIPGPYSMLSFGLAVAGTSDGRTFTRWDPAGHTFYRELRPISDSFDPETLAVSGMDRARLMQEGSLPHEAMREAAQWVDTLANGTTPVLVAYPLAFDWAWLYWYFVRFAESPFGFSRCLDLKTAAAIVLRRPIAESGRAALPPDLRSSRPHTHNAVDDAIEQADILANVLQYAYRGGEGAPSGTD